MKPFINYCLTRQRVLGINDRKKHVGNYTFIISDSSAVFSLYLSRQVFGGREIFFLPCTNLHINSRFKRYKLLKITSTSRLQIKNMFIIKSVCLH